MRNVLSMTEVKSGDIAAAVSNFRFYKDKHEKELEQNLDHWKSTLKPSWFGARRNLHLKTGRQVFYEMYSYYGQYDLEMIKEKLGIWHPRHDHTIGWWSIDYDTILESLLKSPEDSHLLSHELVGWVFKWKDYTEEYE